MDKKNIVNNLISATLGGAACVGVDKLVSMFVDETTTTSEFSYTPTLIGAAIGVALPMVVKGSTADKIGDAILAVQMYKVANHFINDSTSGGSGDDAKTSGLGRLLPSQRAIGLMPSSNNLLPSQQAVGKVVKNNVK
jgi:hypothetical protein